MSIIRSCPYDENGELCKYEKYYGEPVYLKCKECAKKMKEYKEENVFGCMGAVVGDSIVKYKINDVVSLNLVK